jgi:hypothetical protein
MAGCPLISGPFFCEIWLNRAKTKANTVRIAFGFLQGLKESIEEIDGRGS